MKVLSVAHAAVLEGRVDQHLIHAVRQGLQAIVSHAEAPAFCVVRCPIGDQVRLFGKREDVLLQLIQAKMPSDWAAVADDMKIACLEINDTLARIWQRLL